MSSGGFTIVESMIVLGVTGVLFLSLVGMVSGQQSKARFKASMTDITTQIQSQINEVATGFYPSQANFSCSGAGGVVSISAGASTLGTNGGCTYLGRAMMYATSPVTADNEEYVIQTLVGVRKTALGRDPADLREASTRALARGVSTNNVGWPPAVDGSTLKTLYHGTQLVSMNSLNGGPGVEKIAGFAIVAAPNQQLTFNTVGSTESGTIVPSIIPIPYEGVPSGVGVSPAEGVDLINRSLGIIGGTAIPADASDGPIEMCFRSGTTNQSGKVTIGRNNSTTSVEFTIHSNGNCT